MEIVSLGAIAWLPETHGPPGRPGMSGLDVSYNTAHCELQDKSEPKILCFANCVRFQDINISLCLFMINSASDINLINRLEGFGLQNMFRQQKMFYILCSFKPCLREWSSSLLFAVLIPQAQEQVQALSLSLCIDMCVKNEFCCYFMFNKHVFGFI